MKFQKIVSPSMKELFVKQLEDSILSGQLKTGQQLPTEREMAEQMKVSRTITNAGLNELARKGFIEIVPRKGTFVADYKRKGTLETLVSIMHFNGGRFDRKTFDSLMDLRRMLEGECAYLASKNRTDDDLKLLSAQFERIAACTEVEDAAEETLVFHEMVSYASGNMVYPLILKSFRDININFNRIIYQRIGPEYATEYYMDLIEAIRKQESEKAKEIMLLKINSRIKALEEAYFF